MEKLLLVSAELCFLLLLLLPKNCFVYSNSNPVSTLISSMMLDDYFALCEVILVNVRSNENRKSKNYSPLENYFEGSPLANFFAMGSLGIFSVANSDTINGTINVVKFHRLEDIHRLSQQHCGVALLYISQRIPGISKWLFETVTPLYVPIIRKDEDPFVFVFSDENDAEEMLLSQEFGSKIRFKIAILPMKTGEEKPTIKAVDLYGNAGQPIVKSVELGSDGVRALFTDSTRNFFGRQFRVANPKAPSHFQMEPLPNGMGNRPVRGIYKVWLDVMMEKFNFTVDLFLTSYFGGTGKRLKNGTWVGAVGDVLYGHADMASFNGHIYNRHTVVEWSAPVTYEWMAFITQKPNIFFSPSAIFKPFPIILWVGFLVTIILICVVLTVFLKLNPGIKYRMSYSGTMMYLFSSFLEQDADYYLCYLHLSPVRALLMFWLLFAMIISTAYRGKLVSLIAFPALSWVPSNFEELAYSNYRVGLNTLGKGGAVYSVLSTSTNPVYRSIFNRLEINPDSVQCLREALHHDFGCIMVKSIGDVVAYKNFTDKFGRSPFQESDQMALFHADGYIWEKKAVFRQNFDRVTWSILETGLQGLWFQSDLDSLKQKRLAWERETGTISSITESDQGPSKLQLAHLIGLFALYTFGLISSLIFLLGEKYLLPILRGSRQHVQETETAHVENGWLEQQMNINPFTIKRPNQLSHYSMYDKH